MIAIVLNMCDVLLKCVDLRKFSGSAGGRGRRWKPGVSGTVVFHVHALDPRLSEQIDWTCEALSVSLSVCFCTFFARFSRSTPVSWSLMVYQQKTRVECPHLPPPHTHTHTQCTPHRCSKLLLTLAGNQANVIDFRDRSGAATSHYAFKPCQEFP